jgi:hypothetical protein
MIIAPDSIGRLNFFTVLILARNGEAVGWKQIQLAHGSAATEPWVGVDPGCLALLDFEGCRN